MQGRQNPFEQMEALFEQMRRSAFGGWDDQYRPAMPSGRTSDVPTVDGRGRDARVTVETADEGYVVVADLPGFEREEIDLSFDDGVLAIAAAHEVTDEDEYRHRRVHESVRVPGDVNPAESEANYRNGVLEVTLPVDDAVDEAHRIDVE